MSLKLSKHSMKKLAYASEPTPNSVKERVGEIEKAVIREIGEFTPFSTNKQKYQEILTGIQEDLKSVRPIIEYLKSSNGERAFKTNNLEDTYQRYEELKSVVEGSAADEMAAEAPAADPMAAPGGEPAAPEMPGMETPEAAATPEAGGAPDLGVGGAEAGAGADDLELLQAALVDAKLLKRALEQDADANLGLSDKIEKLYFLGRIDSLSDISHKINRVVKIGSLLLAAINNEGRPTQAAVQELNEVCGEALTDISVIESSVEALNRLPDKLESIVNLLKSSLLERIKEIRGAESL